MSRQRGNYDALGRWVQIGSTPVARMVRIVGHDEGNCYTAKPIAFNAAGEVEIISNETFTVVNLAEPSDSDGFVKPDTDAVALALDGKWVVFIRQTSAVIFPARIISSQGSGAYTVREQVATGAGTFTDATGAADLTAYNLAELSLGPGAAVENDTIVLVMTITDNGMPPTTRYIFDHPVYAKYLD